MDAYSQPPATLGRIDWSLFHALNGPLGGNDPAQDAVEMFNAWAILVLAGVAGFMWLLSRPGRSPRSKLVAAGATLSALLGLLANAALGHVWYHPRPFVDHPGETVLLVHHGADNSFPSDHATVAFAIAFAALAFHRRIGLVFLVAATAIGLDRILVGVHYPIDVMASAVVGFSAAALVTTAGRRYLEGAVRLLSRITDPIVEAVVRRLGRIRRMRMR